MKTLALEDIGVSFGAVRALAGVDVSLSSGEVLLLVGPNGAGKSTLMKVLLGLVRADHGRLRIDGRHRRVDNTLKERLGYLPEAVAFSENLTGLSVLRFFARARGVEMRRVDEVLDKVGLRTAARRRVRGYSRGMRQRLGIAVAILADPELLVLDEPTGGLDQEGLGLLWGVLGEWRQKGRMVLVASHDLALLENRVSRICVLDAGKVIAVDSPQELRRSAGLPQRVTMDLAPGIADADALRAALDERGGWEVVRDGDRLHVEVSPDELVELMDLRAGFPQAVTAIRVEEPPFDVVYERLLGEAA